MALSYYLPPIDSNFKWKANPFFIDKDGQDLYDYLEPYGNELFGENEWGKFKKQHTALFTIHVFPKCNDLNKLITACKLIDLLFMIDDYHANSSSKNALTDTNLWQQLLNHLMDIKPTDNEFLKAIHNVFESITSIVSLPLKDSFIKAITAYIYANSVQSNFKNKRQLDIDTYQKHRMNDACGEVMLLLGEYMIDIDLSPSERDHPLMKKLKMLALKQLIFVNDLYSFRKEYDGKSLKGMYHIFSVMVCNEGLNLQEAVNKLVKMIKNCENEFIELRDKWLKTEPVSNDVRIYLDALQDMMGGNLRFSQISPRYHGNGFKGEIISGNIKWNPKKTILSN